MGSFLKESLVLQPGKTLALGAGWQPTFDVQDFDEQAAAQFLQEFGNIGEYTQNSLAPDLCSYRRAVRNKPNSFPGPDFLPCAAWAASGSAGVQCFNEAAQFSNSNASSMAFSGEGGG